MSSGLKAVGTLLTHPRYEVIPSDAIEDVVVATIPRPKWFCQRRLTITRAVSGLFG